MIIVSDTSVITNLIQIEKLTILKELYTSVIIPTKVYFELTHYENQGTILKKTEWIIVKPVSNKNRIKELGAFLDEGESEAIALAEEIRADALIIDERKGREFAKSMGLNVIGLLGVLLQAKREGILLEIKPILEALDKIGFRISNQLYRHILSMAKE
jgi:predicted nucleic acid-binding protein